MIYEVREREAGNFITEFTTRWEAEAEVTKFEEEDKKEGNYTPNFYEINEYDPEDMLLYDVLFRFNAIISNPHYHRLSYKDREVLEFMRDFFVTLNHDIIYSKYCHELSLKDIKMQVALLINLVEKELKNE